MKRIILTENQIRKVISNLVIEATTGEEKKEINIKTLKSIFTQAGIKFK